MKKNYNGPNRHQRKLKKYSNNFNRMFDFFLLSYRKNILTFCGSHVSVEYDAYGHDAREAFRMFDDGVFKNKPILTRHPNILKAVIIGKKAWGLWLNEWTEGIVDWTFTQEEIFEQFKENNITIPESLLLDFENTLHKKKIKRNETYLNLY